MSGPSRLPTSTTWWSSENSIATAAHFNGHTNRIYHQMAYGSYSMP